ncbi:MAG: transcriptional regulator [Lachnospiraceae bacterium]|nr:transcriptional regulator [Lachnospiraceae bacterium]
MNRKEFADWLHIPYGTIFDWEHEERQMPEYVLRLIAYKVRMEFIEKRGE